MDNTYIKTYITIFSTLSGVILGFILSSVKDLIQNRAKLKANFKTGQLAFQKKYVNSEGISITKQVMHTEANCIYMSIKIDILNIGKVSSGITDVSIKLSANNNSLYFTPVTKMPTEGKIITGNSFNVDSNKLCTLDLELEVKKEVNYEFLFDNLDLSFEEEKGFFKFINNNRFKNNKRFFIEVIIETMKNKKIIVGIEPASIMLLGISPENL